MKFILNSILFSLCATSALAQSISLPLPSADAPESCQTLNSPPVERNVILYKSFDGDMKNFRLYDGKWTPHYDGGYDVSQRKWLGYDWISKRTLLSAHEQQVYVDPQYSGNSNQPLGLNPFSVVDGNLRITAASLPDQFKSALPNFSFTSGLITTRSSFLQMYGYFEIFAKVPHVKHFLPAFWLLPFDKSWPPEIDIFEAPGHLEDIITTTIHANDKTGKRYFSSCKNIVHGYQKSFHSYGVLWLPEKLVFYIDRNPVSIVKSPPGFNKPMYMLANLAIGGVWVGRKTDQLLAPVSMDIKDISSYTLSDNPNCSSVQGGVKQCIGN